MIRWVVVMALVAACVGYLVYSASGGTSEYYLTVSELPTHQPANGDVRVAGLPDIFRPGITVVAEGRLGADGIFHARAVLAKCPSRFSTAPYTS